MSRILVIKNCPECKHYSLKENLVRGYYPCCDKIGSVDWQGIPDNCPLDDVDDFAEDNCPQCWG